MVIDVNFLLLLRYLLLNVPYGAFTINALTTAAKEGFVGITEWLSLNKKLHPAMEFTK